MLPRDMALGAHLSTYQRDYSYQTKVNSYLSSDCFCNILRNELEGVWTSTRQGNHSFLVSQSKQKLKNKFSRFLFTSKLSFLCSKLVLSTVRDQFHSFITCYKLLIFQKPPKKNLKKHVKHKIPLDILNFWFGVRIKRMVYLSHWDSNRFSQICFFYE